MNINETNVFFGIVIVLQLIGMIGSIPLIRGEWKEGMYFQYTRRRRILRLVQGIAAGLLGGWFFGVIIVGSAAGEACCAIYDRFEGWIDRKEAE